MSALTMDLQPSHENAPAEDWEPVVRSAMFVPLQMRKRGQDGKWLYRDPTETEILEYLANEAW